MSADSSKPPVEHGEGGDDACWAHLLCPKCDRVLEEPRPDQCPACGAELD